MITELAEEEKEFLDDTSVNEVFKEITENDTISRESEIQLKRWIGSLTFQLSLLLEKDKSNVH